jgi:hypothetical protein
MTMTEVNRHHKRGRFFRLPTNPSRKKTDGLDPFAFLRKMLLTIAGSFRKLKFFSMPIWLL